MLRYKKCVHCNQMMYRVVCGNIVDWEHRDHKKYCAFSLSGYVETGLAA